MPRTRGSHHHDDLAARPARPLSLRFAIWLAVGLTLLLGILPSLLIGVLG